MAHFAFEEFFFTHPRLLIEELEADIENMLNIPLGRQAPSLTMYENDDEDEDEAYQSEFVSGRWDYERNAWVPVYHEIYSYSAIFATEHLTEMDEQNLPTVVYTFFEIVEEDESS